MNRAEERLLLIADLSGYTGYLVGGEAEEAPLIAGDLVETVVNQLSKDFELSGLEGDAAFVHGPVADFRGRRLLDVIGECDAAFRRRIESVRQATTCPCEACRTAPTLDPEVLRARRGGIAAPNRRTRRACRPGCHPPASADEGQ